MPVPRHVLRLGLGRNVVVLGAVSFFTDVSSEMIYPLLPVFLATTLGSTATTIGMIEGAAESASALLKLASGWVSDRIPRRKPLVVAGYGLSSIVRPLVGLARSAGHVLAIRLIDRVGKGVRTAPRDALIADSVPADRRGKAFGFHRAADHAGALVGPLVAFVLLEQAGVSMRALFLLSAIPAALAVVALVLGVKEIARAAERAAPGRAALSGMERLGRRFWVVLGVIFVFTLGNSTDAFLLLRAAEVGIPTAHLPLLWALLHLVKAAASTPGGALSDRLGRRVPIVLGWLLFAAVYFAFGRVTEVWQAWALFAGYGLYFALTEGPEKALVADLVPPERRGAAFGAYNLAVGLGALPASLIFGLLWDRAGVRAAFDFGAALALAAAIGLAVVLPRRR